MRPMYTAITLMPSARPRSLGGKTAVTIAADVAPTRAAPAPWTILETMSQELSMLSAQNSEATVNTAVPSR